MEKEVKVVRATHDHAQGIADLFNRVYNNKYPIVEFTKSEPIKKLLDSGYIWYIGVDRDLIVGSACGIPALWNRSMEVGRTVVEAEYRKSGIGVQMFSDIVAESPLDIVWGYSRNKQMVRLVQSYDRDIIGGPDRYIVTGFVPGKHRVGQRENHFITIYLNDDGCSSRIIPPENGLTELEIFKDITGRFPFPDLRGDYPSDVIVGNDEFEEAFISKAGDVHYTQFPEDKSIEIRQVRSNNPVEAVRMFIDTNHDQEYIELEVLVDKESQIRELMVMGFRPCSVMPGWFMSGNNRFDCIRLARYIDEPRSSADSVIEEMVTKVEKGFESYK